MRVLLAAKNEAGDPVVEINSCSRRIGGLMTSSVLIPQEQKAFSTVSFGNQQHPILYWAVFKYQFKLAMELITSHGADPTVLNSNNSNLLHILFANFDHDPQHAPQLAELLILKKVNLNLVDKDGKTPLLVAIKKSQQAALEFAHSYNIGRRSALVQDPTYANASSLIRKSMNKLELFDFELKSRKVVSPLHYAIKKSNYDAFMYLARHQLCDTLARNEDQLTPRLSALINSAFYRILLKEEHQQVKR